MSRHFEALNRLQQQGNDAAGEVWSALESAPRSTVTAEAEAPIEEPLPEIEPSPAAPEIEPEAASAAPVAEPLTLDKRARLLPFAANSAVVERYRSLRTKILQQQAENPFRTVVVTSSHPQEGKSVTAINLALSFAMVPGYRVLVVDGDLRKGTIGQWLKLSSSHVGFGNMMEASATFEQAVVRLDGGGVDFVVSGSSSLPPAELLNSPVLKTQLTRMAQDYDLVLVDSPPMSIVADAQLLASNCDAVLLVARAYSTSKKAFDKVVQDLSKCRIIGTVLNAAVIERASYYSY